MKDGSQAVLVVGVEGAVKYLLWQWFRGDQSPGRTEILLETCHVITP